MEGNFNKIMCWNKFKNWYKEMRKKIFGVVVIIVKVIKLTKYLLTKRIWFLFSVFLLFVALLVVAPNPLGKTDLWLSRNAPLEDPRSQKEYQGRISDALSSIFSIPLLFKQYDIVFNNTSRKECDQDIIIMLNKDTVFASVASKYFGEPFTNDENFIQYKINEGDKVVVRSYPIKNQISYDTWVRSNWDAEGLKINNNGQIFPSPDCPKDVDYSILEFYAKPNLFNWLISTFALFFASIVFVASLRGVWNKQKDNK